MRKPGLLFLSLIILVSAHVSAEDMSISLTADLSALDSFFTSGKRVSAELGMTYDRIAVSVPFTYGFSLDEEIGVTDLAISVKLYPLQEYGLYFSSDLFSWIHIFGADSPTEKDMFPSSFSVGYTFRDGFFLMEPELIFQNPQGIASTTQAFLSRRFLEYMDLYFALKLGVNIEL